jgi:hypothetical protein
MDKEPTPAAAPVESPRLDEAEEICYPDGRIEHPLARFEPKDIRVGWLVVLLVGVCCFAATQYYLIWRLFWYQAHAQERVKTSLYPWSPAGSTAMPPEPRLEQVDRLAGVDSSDADKQRVAQEKVLRSFGPTGDKGFVHIPIEQAMKAVAGKLPVAKQASPSRAANGLLEAGQSNSGRMFRGSSP